LTVRPATPDEIADWDERTVDPPGGHVYQSRAWAEHRAASGWTPHHLVVDDTFGVLALSRPWPIVGGGSAYIPRGPISAGSPPPVVASRLVAVADHLADAGTDVVATDAEIPADSGYGEQIRAAGFRPIEEIQPSRHRISLRLEGVDEEAAFEAIAKSTRQRVRKAEKDAIDVVRHDGRLPPGGVGEGFVAPGEPTDVALDRFYDLLLETGERRQFSFGPRESFVANRWRACCFTGTASASRPSTRATMPRHDAITRALSTCSAGGRSSSRFERSARRWTSAGPTSREHAASRGRESRCTVSTSTSSRSAAIGWSSPGRTRR
jgi:lipid II:glycine glycyltransferase (peptidoglycan interpeptide bridge formation enzyme)